MSQCSASVARNDKSTPARFKTGNAPGKPKVTGSTSVLGGASAKLGEATNCLDCVSNSAWTSMPMTTSYLVSREAGVWVDITRKKAPSVGKTPYYFNKAHAGAEFGGARFRERQIYSPKRFRDCSPNTKTTISGNPIVRTGDLHDRVMPGAFESVGDLFTQL